MTKIAAFHGGGAWYDAYAKYLVIPGGMNIKEERIKYGRWYDSVYCSSQQGRPGREGYIDFVGWLIEAGAREPTEDELEIVEMT